MWQEIKVLSTIAAQNIRRVQLFKNSATPVRDVFKNVIKMTTNNETYVNWLSFFLLGIQFSLSFSASL